MGFFPQRQDESGASSVQAPGSAGIFADGDLVFTLCRTVVQGFSSVSISSSPLYYFPFLYHSSFEYDYLSFLAFSSTPLIHTSPR